MLEMTNNLFLDSLCSESRAILMKFGTVVSLPKGTVLHESRTAPEHAYLLTSGIASTITRTINGDCAEVGLIGHEGLTAGLQLLGPSPMLAESMIQI